MAQDEPSGLDPIRSLFKRLFGGGSASSAADTTPTATNAALPLEITDANRAQYIQLAQSAPFAYGYWSQVKRLYKAAEAVQDWDILQPLAARLDTQPFPEKPEMLPTPLAQTNFNYPVRYTLVGTVAYLLSQHNPHSLVIVDVSDPVQPRPLGNIAVDSPVDVVVNGNLAYVVSGYQYYRQEGALHVIDVSDPASPKSIATQKFKYPTRAAMLENHLAVISGNYSQDTFLTILDVSNAQSFVTVSKSNIDAPIAIAVEKQTIYTLTGEYYQSNQKITTYDASNPIHPRSVSTINVPGATNLYIYDNHLYVTVTRNNYYQAPQYKEGLYIFRLDANHSPVEPATILEIESANTLAFAGSRAYVGFTGPGYGNIKQSGLKILDVAVPAQPRIMGEFKNAIVSLAAISPDDSGHLFVSAQTQVYRATSFHVLDVSRPELPFLLGAMPTIQTFGYMKRRVRRALRTLAEQDPAQYVQQAAQILLTAGKGRQEIDARIQWVSMDILYGNSRRYEQASHSRGAYLLRGKHLSLRTREERHPEFWDRYPQQAETLLVTPELPWQTHEAACKMLRGMKRDLPSLPDATLIRFLQAPSPLLVSVAARALAARLANGETIPADMAAEAFFKGGGRSRKAVTDYIARQANLSSRWSNPFANRLYKLAGENVRDGKLTRRQGIAFAYLVAHFPAVLSKQISPELAVMLYAARRPELNQWGLDTFRQVSVAQLDVWLQSLEALPEDLRDPALAALLESVRSKPIPTAKMRDLVNAPSDWIRRAGWDLIATSPTPDSDLALVWDELLASTVETDALRAATASPAAIALFNRLSLDGTRLQGLLETRPFLVGLLPQSALQNIVRVLPVASILGLAQAATDAQWPELRQTIINGLTQSGQIPAFWLLAWKQVGSANNPVLTARLLADAVISATFLTLDGIEFLDTANPLYGPILGRWVRVHETLFAADSPALLQIATHALPEIRAWGLQRVGQVGMRMPFALRLLESELPPAVDMGKTFFEAVPFGDEHSIEYITALCDSPKAPVRAYGRQYLEARWETVRHEDVFSRLSENTDPQMEAFLANRLLKTSERFAQAPTFDRQVLRARNQGRQAKELVKRRLDAEPSQDIPLLLELARGRSSRDAEWALGQLARLALAGVEIEGVEV